MQRSTVPRDLGQPVEKSSSTPAHVQVYQQILTALQTGNWKVGDPLPSELDISRQFGVSRMTANKAILRLAADGWVVREKGRGTFVAERPERPITRCFVLFKKGVTEGAQEDYYYGALYWAIRRFCHELDLRLDVGTLSPNFVREYGEFEDSIFIALNPDHLTASVLGDLHRLGRSVVIVGSSWESEHVHTIDSDNLLGAAMAVNHLIDLGHRRIAFVGAGTEDSNTVDRLRGFKIAMRARGLEVPEVDVFMGSDTRRMSEQAEGLLVDRLTGKDPITAIFAAGPHLAMCVLRIAQQAEISVPGALSLVAYDDPAFLDMTNPPLTTIRQPLEEMALSACEIVLKPRIPVQDHPKQVVLEPDLIIRGSTAQAPASRSAIRTPHER